MSGEPTDIHRMWNVVSTVIASVALLVSLTSMRSQRRTAVLQILASREERWNCLEDMRHFRIASAKWWLENKSSRPSEVMELTPETIEIVDFLNNCYSVACLSRYAKRMTWNWVGDAIQLYWNAYGEDMEYTRVVNGDPLAAPGLEAMNSYIDRSERLLRILRTRDPDVDPPKPWSPEMVAKSMKRELVLEGLNQ